MKRTKQRGSKVDHASKGMISLAIDNAARDSMSQLTGQLRTGLRGACQAAIKMTNGSHARKLFFKNGRRSHQRIANSDGE